MAQLLYGFRTPRRFGELWLSVEEFSSKGSKDCQDAFAYLREQLRSEQNVSESLEYEPLKESEAPTYSVGETPRVRVFFGEKLELFIFIPERSVAGIKSDETVPESLRPWVDKAQLGGMSRLLRVQLATKRDVEVIMPLIKAVIHH